MELIILECFAAFFMFLSIIRPLLRGLWKLPGLAVCPLLALGIITGIFPAYGFRPECIPLLICAVFLFIANIWDFLALFSGLQSDSYRDRSLLFTLGSAVLFAFTLSITFHYAPPMNDDLATEGVKTLFLQEGELHIRIYGPVPQAEQPKSPNAENLTDPVQSVQERPLLILLPPAAGSFIVSDEVCSALRDRGFTVLSCSRLNFDSPSFDRNGIPVRLNAAGLYRLGNALARGLSDVAANAGGRQLENSRKEDIVFLLRELSENKTLPYFLGPIDKNMVFLAGYGAGGAALTVLAGDDDFSSGFPQLRGIIAIEAPLLSSLEGDDLPEPPPFPTDPVNAFYRQAEEFMNGLKPRKITRITKVPRPGLPILFLLSDRVINEREGRYETILRTARVSKSGSLVAAVRGAGPFDYSASPKYYPMYSFLFRGAEQTEKNHNWPELTASIITNFAVLVLENGKAGAVNNAETESSDETASLPLPLVKTALDSSIYLERGGVWNIPDVQTILRP